MSSANDTVDAGAGNDIITTATRAGSGTDSINGGTGTGTGSGSGRDSVRSTGNDTLATGVAVEKLLARNVDAFLAMSASAKA